MRLQSYLNENFVDTVIKKIRGMSFKKMSQFLKSQFDKFVSTINDIGDPEVEQNIVKIINSKMGTNYSSFVQMSKEGKKQLKESTIIKEDLAHLWDVVKSEGFPTLAFYPALTAWLEIDKLLRGQDINVKVLIVYALFWLLLVSGKYAKGWAKWKKENPEEYAAERAQGKGGLI